MLSLSFLMYNSISSTSLQGDRDDSANETLLYQLLRQRHQQVHAIHEADQHNPQRFREARVYSLLAWDSKKSLCVGSLVERPFSDRQSSFRGFCWQARHLRLLRQPVGKRTQAPG